MANMASFSNPFGRRRAVFAAFVFLVTLVVAGGAVGFAAAADPGAAPSPGTLQIAEPRFGDYARYSIAEFSKNSVTPEEPPNTLIAFEWLGSQVLRDSSGAAHVVNTLAYTDPCGSKIHDGDGVTCEPKTWFRHHDATTRQLVGIGGGFNQTSSHIEEVAGLVPVYATSSSWDLSFTVLTPKDFLFEYAPFCGIFSAFQGRPIDLSEPIAGYSACNHFEIGSYVAGPPTSLSFVGREEMGSDAGYSFRLGLGAYDAFVWFKEAVPYPVLFLIEPTGPDETTKVIRLEEFRRGTKPLEENVPPPTLPEVSDVEWAGRQAWGLDEAGIQHPFPLSKAFAFVRDDPQSSRVRDFLSGSPPGYLSHASYSERTRPEDNERSWQMEFANGKETFPVKLVEKTFNRTLPVIGTNDPRYGYQNLSNGNIDRPGPSLDQLPATMPTVSSLLDVWQSFSGSTETGNQWEFQWSCFGINDDPCVRATLDVSAGFGRTFSETSPNAPPGTSRYQAVFDVVGLSFLDPTVPDRTVTLLSSRHNMRSDLGVKTPGDEAAPAPLEPQQAARVPARPWVLPTEEYALGAGALALLVGLMYWLWPAAKHMAIFGLFSRLDKPKILDHPSRQRLHDLVAANPGIHFAELCRRSGLGHGTTEHHLRQLVAKNVVTQVQNEGYCCYYVPGALSANTAKALPFLKSEGAREILKAIQGRTGLTAVEVARTTGLTPPSVHYHVDRLKKAGLVEVRRGSAGLELSPTPNALAALAAT